MKVERRRRHRSATTTEQFDKGEAGARMEAGKRWLGGNERALVLGLRAWLLILPGLVVLSVVDPTGLLQRKVLLFFSPVVWVAWAVVCFWAGLSAAELAARSGCSLLIRGNNETFFSILGLANCASAVGVLWLAAGPG